MIQKDDVIAVLETIMDPEIQIDIWTLGLIYDIKVQDDIIDIRMTFTSMACPMAPQIVEEVKNKTQKLTGIKKTNVEVVFYPPWKPSEELMAVLGLN